MAGGEGAYSDMCDRARARKLDVELHTIGATYGLDGRLQIPGRLSKIRVTSGSSIVATADIRNVPAGLEIAARTIINRLKLTA